MKGRSGGCINKKFSEGHQGKADGVDIETKVSMEMKDWYCRMEHSKKDGKNDR